MRARLHIQLFDEDVRDIAVFSAWSDAAAAAKRMGAADWVMNPVSAAKLAQLVREHALK